jgi:hypothetical protein
MAEKNCNFCVYFSANIEVPSIISCEIPKKKTLNFTGPKVCKKKNLEKILTFQSQKFCKKKKGKKRKKRTQFWDAKVGPKF